MPPTESTALLRTDSGCRLSRQSFSAPIGVVDSVDRTSPTGLALSTGLTTVIRADWRNFAVENYFSLLRLSNILRRFAAFCSSEIVGSFEKRSQGSDGHLPQFVCRLSFTQQSYTRQQSSPVYCSQKTFPFIFRHPAHCKGNSPHATQIAPQGEGLTYSSFQYHHWHFAGSGFSVFTKYSTARYR